MAKYTIEDSSESGLGNTQHVVDLQSNNQAPQLIRSCCIKVARRTRLWGALGRTPVDSNTLSVSYANEDGLIVKESNNLLYINYCDQKDKVVNVEITSNEVQFQLFLNPNEIIDCRVSEGSESNSFCIKYSVELTNDKGEAIDSMDGEIHISFNDVSTSAPIFEFIPNEKGRNLTYTINDSEPNEIGELRIHNPGQLLRFPYCNLTFECVAKHRDSSGGRLIEVPELIYFDNPIKESCPRIQSDNGFVGIPVGVNASQLLPNFNSNSKVTLKKLYVNRENERRIGNDNYVSIPVYWDMTKVTNPNTDTKEYIIYINVDYTFNGRSHNDQSFDDKMIVSLKKNKVLMDIEVSLSDGEKHEILFNGHKSTLRTPLMLAGATTTYDVMLKNTADAVESGKEGACIYVKEFKATIPESGVYYSECPGRVNARVFSIVKGSIAANNGRFPIGVGSSRNFVIEIDHTCIDKIYSDERTEIFEREIRIPVEFKYIIDKNDEYASIDEIPNDKWITFATALRIHIQKEPSPEWLCLDYGTSAVVAAYGSSRYDKHGALINRLLELREVKQKKISSLYHADKNQMKDESENSPHLITSATVVNDKNPNISDEAICKMNDNVDNYLKSPIWFSPTTGMIDIYSWMLPSLKTFVGNKSLPSQLIPDNVKATGEITVNNVFELVYKQLFSHFLPQEVKETNKLVITIPNTYAPVHIEILKDLAKKSFPKLRTDYLQFLSESDAVAFYYLAKKNDFIKQSGLYSDDFDSNVLVYDMGAGTLDLTYFTQREKGNNTIVSIDGKMGITRAGNYLDYLLAEILVKLVAPEITDERLRTSVEDLLNLNFYRGRDPEAASALKEYVRNIIKPSLDDSKKILPSLKLFNKDIPTNSFTNESILEHEAFKEYLKEISQMVLSQFKALFSKNGNDVKPSLIIFSGRTTNLLCVRKAVQDALTALKMVDGDCMFLDLASGKISKDITTHEEGVSNLKTVVVDGALAFCTDFAAGNGDFKLKNKNVYAQYGIMFKSGQRWIWENLIDTTTTPVCEGEEFTNYGMTINQYDSSLHDASEHSEIGRGNYARRSRNFSGITQAYILQSYSNNTEEDWINGNKDMISVIGYADLTNVQGDREYKIVIDSMNQLHVHIGQGQLPLLAHDEYATTSFQKSMWPIVRKSL